MDSRENEHHDQADEASGEGDLVGIVRPLEQGQNTPKAESLVDSKQEESTCLASREEHSLDGLQDDGAGCVGQSLDSAEIYFFAEARHDLVTHRSESQLGTMFAIASLVGALVGAFIKA